VIGLFLVSICGYILVGYLSDKILLMIFHLWHSFCDSEDINIYTVKKATLHGITNIQSVQNSRA
jgi:hypothetical protein